MLLYLALHPEGAAVEQLADVLLPETDVDHSRNRLWQSASEARRVLGNAFRRDDDGRYSVDRDEVRIDIDELNRLLSRSPTDTDQLEAALSLYRGEPLAEIDWVWADGQARQLRATYIDLLERVGRARLRNGDVRGALELVELGLSLDKLNESLWRLAMEADIVVGLRDSVTKRYTHLRNLLEDELGIEPASQTRSLYLTLLGPT